MGSDLVQLRLESAVGAQQRFRGHGRGDVRRPEAALGVGAREREHAQHAVGPVDKGQALLRFELQRLQLCRLESLKGRPRGAVGIGDLAFADQGQRDVGQWGEVSTAADRAVPRHNRSDPRVEQGDQRFGQDRPDPRETHGKSSRPQQHGRADHLVLDRLAHAGRMGADQRQLELGLPERGHPGAGQGAETCRNPVDGLA